ncbi:hypothetical protein DSO57_1028936 [Entomophthora muscae]|uniref:Uncharacterized protein n=1 Tax=Entomophthora muscae TaxID=34485 RepID=A0ACC2UMA6_9FUNG|nr:hypothetical protein DSO57_1028936 [Entomophthora muscae]
MGWGKPPSSNKSFEKQTESTPEPANISDEPVFYQLYPTFNHYCVLASPGTLEPVCYDPIKRAREENHSQLSRSSSLSFLDKTFHRPHPPSPILQGLDYTEAPQFVVDNSIPETYPSQVQDEISISICETPESQVHSDISTPSLQNISNPLETPINQKTIKDPWLDGIDFPEASEKHLPASNLLKHKSKVQKNISVQPLANVLDSLTEQPTCKEPWLDDISIHETPESQLTASNILQSKNITMASIRSIAKSPKERSSRKTNTSIIKKTSTLTKSASILDLLNSDDDMPPLKPPLPLPPFYDIDKLGIPSSLCGTSGPKTWLRGPVPSQTTPIARKPNPSKSSPENLFPGHPPELLKTNRILQKMVQVQKNTRQYSKAGTCPRPLREFNRMEFESPNPPPPNSTPGRIGRCRGPPRTPPRNRFQILRKSNPVQRMRSPVTLTKSSPQANLAQPAEVHKGTLSDQQDSSPNPPQCFLKNDWLFNLMKK